MERFVPRCRIFWLDGKKFRTNLLVLFFDLPLKRETATKTALLAEVLRGRNREKRAKTAEELYGALWDVRVVKKGDRQLLLFSLELLKVADLAEGIAFLEELLQAEDFSEQLVERQKKILRRKLDALRDDKKGYARSRALEETAAGTAFALSGDGYAEDFAEIDHKNLYAYYVEVMEQGSAQVFFCGEQADRKKVLPLRNRFGGKVPLMQERETGESKMDEPRFVSEAEDVAQARLILGFRGDMETAGRAASLLVLNRILGGDGDSLLFRKVREEGGLCYDIKSYRYTLSPYLFVQAGIREADAKETGKLILQCLEQLKKEAVSAEKLKQAKENILRGYDSLADDPWAMVDFFAEQSLQGKELTTEKFLRQIERVEQEDILRAAHRLHLQTVYLLGGKGEEPNANE